MGFGLEVFLEGELLFPLQLLDLELNLMCLDVILLSLHLLFYSP